MHDSDKAKVKEAFKRALERDPKADNKVENIVDGVLRETDFTKRQIVEKSLGSDQFYADIEEILDQKGITLDEYLDAMEDHPSNGGPGTKYPKNVI